MKRIWNVLTCIVLALVMLLLTVEPALADTITEKQTFTINTLEAGTIVTGKNTDSWNSAGTVVTRKIVLYKITVPDNGYIKITNYQGNTLLFKTLADAKAYAKDTRSDYVYADIWGKGTAYVSVEKGTYYFGSYPWESTFKFKYTFTKVTVPTTNLCFAKATTLATGTKKTICVPDGYEAPRWYKIKVTSKKTISINFKDLRGIMDPDSPRFALYNSDGDYIGVVHGDGNTYKSVKKLPVGTYYIRVNTIDRWNNGEYYQNYLYTLSWK